MWFAIRHFACILILLLAGIQSVSGQQITPAALEDLERQMAAAGNVQKVEKQIELANGYAQLGNFGIALDWAEEAESYAKSLRRPDMRAKAYYAWGSILVKSGKRGAAAKFEDAIELSRKSGVSDKKLLEDALTQLRSLAVKNNKYKDVAAIDAQLSELNKSSGTNAQASNEHSNGRQELKQELNNLANQLAQQKAAKDSADARMSKLLSQSQVLQGQLVAQEAAISQMTAEQMKTELLLMQKNSMLDSLLYRTRLDSLSLANADLVIQKAETGRNLSRAIIAILLLLFGGAAYSFVKARQNARILQEKNSIIEAERQRSENLLLNILPALVAEELKQHGQTSARYYDDVCVLFADFVNFSQIAEGLPPTQLVSDLDTCFKAFDAIIAKHGLEKIKTIGDAYMCAGGLTAGSTGYLKAMVLAAHDIQVWLNQWNQSRDQDGLPRYDARIGIHRGPVVAGVVGSKKFAFDIWGDTVNIAARIEQAGEGGKINVSGPVYDAIKGQIACKYRGKVAAKNKGEIDMYFVEN